MKWLTAGVMILATVPVIRGFAPPSQGGGQSRWGYRIVNTYPHDANAFTQGLVVVDGVMYESTGQLGRSSLRRVELATGKVLQKLDVDAKHFAEGLAAWQDSLYPADLAVRRRVRLRPRQLQADPDVPASPARAGA